MLDSIVSSLTAEKSIAIMALLLLVVGQGYALWKTWEWHRKDRQEDRERWVSEVEENTRQLSALVEAITQLRMMIAQCTSFRVGKR